MESERVHLHKNVKLLWFLPIGALLAFVFLVSTIAFLAIPDITIVWITRVNYFIALPALALALGLLVFGWIEIVYRNFTYQLGENELIVRKGVFTHKTDTIPFSNIQDITSERSLSERFFGIATLRIETAGSSHLISETELPGIANKEEVIGLIMGKVKRSKNTMDAESRAQGADTSNLLTGILNQLKAISLKLEAGRKPPIEKKNEAGKGRAESSYNDYEDFKKR
ncbi:MAG: PH domain-containing protein [Candidatus Micrarchaeota archaeon]|nr:PH domain-containing protein [Candidatus Micrarchaeota archaeon]